MQSVNGKVQGKHSNQDFVCYVFILIYLIFHTRISRHKTTVESNPFLTLYELNWFPPPVLPHADYLGTVPVRQAGGDLRRGGHVWPPCGH